jgi:ribonuclease HI
MSLNIYCDGCCINNGKKDAKGGIGIYIDNEHLTFLNVSEPLYKDYIHTNQKAELTALLRVLQIINNEEILEMYKSFNIYTDSSYAINCCTTWVKNWIKNNWKKADGGTIINLDLIKELYNEYNKCQSKYIVNIIHVLAHTGKSDDKSIGNDKADKLSKSGAYMIK